MIWRLHLGLWECFSTKNRKQRNGSRWAWIHQWKYAWKTRFWAKFQKSKIHLGALGGKIVIAWSCVGPGASHTFEYFIDQKYFLICSWSHLWVLLLTLPSWRFIENTLVYWKAVWTLPLGDWVKDYYHGCLDNVFHVINNMCTGDIRIRTHDNHHSMIYCSTFLSW